MKKLIEWLRQRKKCKNCPHLVWVGYKGKRGCNAKGTDCMRGVAESL